jgi:hypothetical protein
MNCPKCNKPLAANSRFCPNCGEPISSTPVNHPTANPIPSYQPAFRGEPPTLPPDPQQNEPLIHRPDYQQGPQYQNQGAAQHQPAFNEDPPTLLPGPQQNEPLILRPGPQQNPQYQNQGAAQHWQQPLSAPSQPQQSPYVQSSNAARGINTNASIGETRPRRRGRGCLVGFISLVVLAVLLVGGWFLVLRPYLNNMVSSKLDSVLTNAVNKIPPEVAVAPAGRVPLSETVLNNLLVLNSSPDDVVKNTQIHVTSAAMSLQFQVFGFTSTVSGVPKVVQGQLVATNVTVDGIAALIFTPDEITALANRHLAEAQTKIQHAITSVELGNHELILVLGAPGSTPGGVPLPVGSPTPGGIPFPSGSPPTIP